MSSGYASYDALDAAMGQDDPMADFANTEFDQDGRILTSAGFTPAEVARRANAGGTPGARPKSVNWPDDPNNDNGSGILVDTNEWGEWGSATPGITPGDQARRQQQQPLETSGSQYPNTQAEIPPPSPVSSTNAPRGILSRAVSRAAQNTHSNRAENQAIQFDRAGFSDSAFNFDDLEVPAAETMADQSSKYNNKYLEYRASQMNRQRAAPVIKKSAHDKTDTIVSTNEVLPPVYSTKMLSQGLQQYELINSSVNLGAAIALDEKRKNQAEFKQQLDLDKMRQIDQSRRPIPRLDPAIEKTGFLIGRQRLSTAESTPNKRKNADEYKRILQEDSMRSIPGADINRKELIRRAATPKAFEYKPSTAQTRKNEEPVRRSQLKRGEQKRQDLRINRDDLRKEMITNRLSLADQRRARSHVGGSATFNMEKNWEKSFTLSNDYTMNGGDSLDNVVATNLYGYDLGPSGLKDTPF
jgi:hypothetical protein